MNPVKQELDDKTLILIEKESGRKFQWQKKRIFMESKRILDLLNSENLKQEAIDQAVKHYADVVKEFDDYVRTADDLTSGSSAYTSRPANLLSQVRDYRDAKKKKNNRQAVNAYNNAVQTYNHMVNFSNF